MRLARELYPICRIAVIKRCDLYTNPKEYLAKVRMYVFLDPDQGRTNMGAMKRPAVQRDGGPKKPLRQIPPADYGDEVTDEQLDTLRKHASPAFEGEEWDVVDGPAW